MVTSSNNKTIGQVLENKELKNTVSLIMGEIVDIANKKGGNLPEDIIEDSLKKAENFSYNYNIKNVVLAGF